MKKVPIKGLFCFYRVVNFFKSAIVAVGFSALKTKLPATRTSAPASTNCFAFLLVTPPSTSIM